MLTNSEISVGDYVKYLKDPFLNGGLEMSVVETNETEAKIGYFDNKGTHCEKWISFDDLKLIHKAQGGFRNAGELP